MIKLLLSIYHSIKNYCHIFSSSGLQINRYKYIFILDIIVDQAIYFCILK